MALKVATPRCINNPRKTCIYHHLHDQCTGQWRCAGYMYKGSAMDGELSIVNKTLHPNTNIAEIGMIFAHIPSLRFAIFIILAAYASRKKRLGK